MDVYQQSRTQAVFSGTILLILLATIAVGARLTARKISVAGLWWDDYVIVLAQILDWCLSACYWLQVRYSKLGRHTVAYGGPAQQGDLVTFFKIFLPQQVLYFASAVAIKTSLILLYYRIFGVIRWFRWLLAAVWATVLLNFVMCLFVAIFECKPVAFYWDKSISGGTCINENQFYRWTGVANLLIDFVIWSLTLPVIWHLKLSTRQKLSLSVIFLLGLVACVASVIRVVAFGRVVYDDITYTLATVSIWTSIEQSVGIVCACLPTTRPLFGRLLSKIKHSDKGHTDEDPLSRSGAIPLPDYKSRQNTCNSFDLSTTGFARLEEENALAASSITTDTSRPGDDLPKVPQRIVKQSRLEQHVEDGIWSPIST